jgi:hypothetical protein
MNEQRRRDDLLAPLLRLIEDDQVWRPCSNWPRSNHRLQIHPKSSTLSAKRPTVIKLPQCGAIHLKSLLVSSTHRCRSGGTTDTSGATVIFRRHAMLFDQGTLHYDPVAELP